MLLTAWLEISLIQLRALIKLVVPIESEFMITIMSTRLLSQSVISVLSLTVGVSSTKVLIDFVDGILRFRIEKKVG